MAITLKDLKPKDLSVIEREYDYQGLVKFKLKMGGDKIFSAAMARYTEMEQEEKEARKSKTRRELLLRKNQDPEEMSAGETYLFIVGEYVLSDWDVLQEDGTKMPISGDSLTSLSSQIGTDDENIGFIKYLFEAFSELSKDFAAQKESAKKKPLRSGSGSKKTAS